MGLEHNQQNAPRFRRLRQNSSIRSLIQEKTLSVSDLIWPIFVIEGQNEAIDIPTMPGVQRLTIDKAIEAAKFAKKMGIPALCIFPCVDIKLKSEMCEEAWNINNLSNRAVAAIKSAVPDTVCSIDSIEKLVCLLYTTLKNVIWGLPVKYISCAPYATNCNNPPPIIL